MNAEMRSFFVNESFSDNLKSSSVRAGLISDRKEVDGRKKVISKGKKGIDKDK